ncbi:MAG: hypothetical protein DRJ31_10740 [Candidatus Methanomethylicota archaeon]|uniref:DUF1156 domain-containing protein n=1 Tax=Thermoproteota archaeon TaxID=2056631 RepID=A0A497EKI7_9CREN|nr:MAG: hypothetical protein DRJ31_10740 [Candidatus Verstraetearchaeota archaeon]
MSDTQKYNSEGQLLIESWFPVEELSRDAAIEMAYKAIPAYIKHCKELKITRTKIDRNFYDPKIRNLHPWFARRPCSVARALTLAAILPSKIHYEDFMEAIGWTKKKDAFLTSKYPPLLFYTDPNLRLIKKLLHRYTGKNPSDLIICDPMAGGGTIPLESLRLGLKSIAVEYNPVAYLILKGTIEFPSLYGRKLSEYVKEESIKLISYAVDALGRFYPEDSEGYIVARGIKCPFCKGEIPLLHDAEIARSTYVDLKFDSSNKMFTSSITKFPVTLPYESEKRGEIKCPYCKNRFTKREAYKVWTENHTSILEELKRGIFNRNKILSTHILLVKQTKHGYVPCEEKDILAFLDACKTLMDSYKQLEEYLPKDQIPSTNEVFSPIREYGIRYWYELFNPRQLLSLAVLIKYVHDRCEFLLSKGKIGVAVSLYLALGISRLVDYNSIATTWKKGTIRDTIGRYAQGRKITYGEAYCEAIVPYRNLNWIFEPNFSVQKRTQGGICPIVSELCKRLENKGEKATIIHGDSRFLSSLISFPIDVINVDPPYFDQHIYSDISEYFWQVLKIMLMPIIKTGVLFKESKLAGWKPDYSCVPREGEIIARKSRIKITKPRNENLSFNEMWYTRQMGRLFSECYKVLKDDGILLTWFTHRSFEAWKAVISALYAGGFYVTRIWPVTSELITRLVSKGNNSVLNKTLVICARKRKNQKVDEKNIELHVVNMMENILKVLTKINASKSELHTFLRAAAMCAITKAPMPEEVQDPFNYCEEYLFPVAMKIYEANSSALIRKFRCNIKDYTLEEFF